MEVDTNKEKSHFSGHETFVCKCLWLKKVTTL